MRKEWRIYEKVQTLFCKVWWQREGKKWFCRLTGCREQWEIAIKQSLQHVCVCREGDIWNYTRVVFLFFLKWHLDNLMKLHNFILLEVCGCTKKLEISFGSECCNMFLIYYLSSVSSAPLLLMSEALELLELVKLIKCVPSAQDFLTLWPVTLLKGLLLH